MNKSLLQKYVEAKILAKNIAQQIETMGEEILKDFKKNKLEKVESEMGNFTISRRTSYTYSKKIKALDEKLKVEKLKEVQKGTAEEKVTEYLLFTAPKVD